MRCASACGCVRVRMRALHLHACVCVCVCARSRSRPPPESTPRFLLFDPEDLQQLRLLPCVLPTFRMKPSSEPFGPSQASSSRHMRSPRGALPSIRERDRLVVDELDVLVLRPPPVRISALLLLEGMQAEELL